MMQKKTHSADVNTIWNDVYLRIFNRKCNSWWTDLWNTQKKKSCSFITHR